MCGKYKNRGANSSAAQIQIMKIIMPIKKLRSPLVVGHMDVAASAVMVVYHNK